MTLVDRYSDRVVDYRRYRWDYAPEAVEALVRECQLSAHASVADVGSGTGMVARHFLDRVRAVFAVEPNAAMRRVAAEALGALGTFQSIDGHSDATTLPDRSVDLITVGRALHWFPAEATRAEFCRILKPDGWLAIFSVPCTDGSLLEALRAVHNAENGWDRDADKEQLRRVPHSFYFGHEAFRTLTVPGKARETWLEFLGRMGSLAAAPGPDHRRRPQFERALRGVFEQRAADGVLEVTNATEITFGQVRHARSRAPSCQADPVR